MPSASGGGGLKSPGTDLTPELIGLLHQKSQIEIEKHDRQTKNQIAVKQLDFQKQESKNEHERWISDREAQERMAQGQNQTELAKERMQQEGWDRQRAHQDAQQQKEFEYQDKVAKQQRDLFEKDRSYAEAELKARGKKVKEIQAERLKNARELHRVEKAAALAKMQHEALRSGQVDKINKKIAEFVTQQAESLKVEQDSALAGNHAAKAAILELAGAQVGDDNWNTLMDIRKPKGFWEKLQHTFQGAAGEEGGKAQGLAPDEMNDLGNRASLTVMGPIETSFGQAASPNDSAMAVMSAVVRNYSQITGAPAEGLSEAMASLMALHQRVDADGKITPEESQEIAEGVQRTMEQYGMSPTQLRGILQGVASVADEHLWYGTEQEAEQKALDASAGARPDQEAVQTQNEDGSLGAEVRKKTEGKDEFVKSIRQGMGRLIRLQTVMDAAIPQLNPKHAENLSIAKEYLKKATEGMTEAQRAAYFKEHPTVLVELGLQDLMKDSKEIADVEKQLLDMEEQQGNLRDLITVGTLPGEGEEE